jgi:hypothetical protein
MSKNKKQAHEDKKPSRPLDVIKKEVEALENSPILKFIIFLLVASVVLEIVVILLSTKHVAYVINTFDISNVGVTHRTSMWKQWGTYGAAAFELALAVVLLGSMIAKKYNMYTWKHTIAVIIFLSVNFIGNMYNAIMLYPHLKPSVDIVVQQEEQSTLTVSKGTINLKPISEDTLKEVDLMYWLLSIAFFGVLPFMSWVLMSQSYSFLLAHGLAKQELEDRYVELIREQELEMARIKKSTSQQDRRSKEKQTLTFGEYTQQETVPEK